MDITLPPSKHKLGYTRAEVKELLKKYKITFAQFNSKFGINTCAMHPKTGETLFYPCDIIRTIKCCLERRDIYQWEWD